jgi:hypothetical protein
VQREEKARLKEKARELEKAREREAMPLPAKKSEDNPLRAKSSFLVRYKDKRAIILIIMGNS